MSECNECGYSCDTKMVGEHHYKQLQAETAKLQKQSDLLTLGLLQEKVKHDKLRTALQNLCYDIKDLDLCIVPEYALQALNFEPEEQENEVDA